MIRFVATDVFDYHRPSKCRLRVSLRAHGVEEARPGPFEETLRRLGKEHEARHLRALAASTDAQIETTAVCVKARFRRGRYRPGRQPVELVRHEASALSHKIVHNNLWDCSEQVANAYRRKL